MVRTALITFLLGYLINLVGIDFLRKHNVRQNIRDDGPKTHVITKTGTPTMGGIFIILTVFAGVLVTQPYFDRHLWLALMGMAGFGAVGLIDDLLKKIRKNNQGLRAWQKMLGLLIVSIVIIHSLLNGTKLDWLAVLVPSVFWLLVLLGTTNAVNLTDGLDGLAAGTSVIAFIAFSFLAFNKGHPSINYFCIIMAAALFSFLWFNHHPASIFMGDVGSLAIGGALGTVAICLHKEINLVIIGGIFVAEALSVIIQVCSFKLTGKRVFRMSPLHHHFELGGWPEARIVTRFWLISVILALFGILV